MRGRAICTREIGSAGAAVLGRTSDGRLVSAILTAVYEYRQPAQCAGGGDGGLSRVPLSRHANGGHPMHSDSSAPTVVGTAATAARHTWWPRHLHVATTVGVLCRTVAVTALLDVDAKAVEARGGGRLLAGVARERASRVLPLWGATCVTTMARAWTVPNNGSLSMASFCSRPLVPLMAPGDAARDILGLPAASDAVGLVDFCALTALRDDTVRHAIAAGVDPYTTHGARYMAAHLWHLEALRRSLGAAHEADRALALCHDLCDAWAF
ncbi:hypothetical protein pdul_cds_822 [Pandoravirus dulcis]|uniref:Uncharacterized protein n=1 Tax=Pandoravirus dulcis TaxID=1349409 RepID=S4VYU1_9VIRU|nr:hypothetical protein pdul_cds_822 [Pandoravirus dulcis]AGO83029.1 hypothetical protein pdul_cds_822 [Pandoravirus dulcis]